MIDCYRGVISSGLRETSGMSDLNFDIRTGKRRCFILSSQEILHQKPPKD